MKKKKEMEKKPTYAELRAWIATYQEGNFSKAASRLGLRPPAVQMLCKSLNQKLEYTLGMRLYTYDSVQRAVESTEVGMQLYHLVAGSVYDIDHVLDFLQGGHKAHPTLLVAANIALFEYQLIDVLGHLREKYQDFNVSTIKEGSVRTLDLLRSGKCHVGFVSSPALAKIRMPQRFVHYHYKTLHIGLYISPAHPLMASSGFEKLLNRAIERGDTKSREGVFKALAGESLILPGTWSLFRQLVEQKFAENNAPLAHTQIQEFEGSRHILMGAAAGLGIALNQPFSVPAELESKLRAFPLTGLFDPWEMVCTFDPHLLPAPGHELVERMCPEKRRVAGERGTGPAL